MKMKLPKLISRKKLRATVARRSLRASTETYEDMSEPNMKLSRALLIVLVLHVVAVSGIVAFNAIKTRQDSFARVSPEVATTPAPVLAPKDDTRSSNLTGLTGQAPTHSSAKPAPKEETKHEKIKSTDHSASDSGKVYVVAKGDNPVAIAKKLKVSYDDLIELNHIDDPRKLQIGQKLLIPKATKPRKAN
jgi:LysM repeat protein